MIVTDSPGFFLDTLVFFTIVLDPFGIVPVFLELTKKDTPSTRYRIARRTCLVSFLVLILFAFAGEKVLNGLKISTSALQISGGVLLFILAIQMVLGQTATNVETDSSGQIDIAVFPLAIPLISGPGALAAIMMKMREAEGDSFHEIVIILSVVLVLAFLYVLMCGSVHMVRIMGETLMSIMTRLAGIILAALAVQFILTGLSSSLF